MLGIRKAALHGERSRVKRLCPTTLPAINHHLKIPGYYVVLSETWAKHGQTRLLVYLKETVSHKVIKLPISHQDLSLLTLEVWKRGQRRTLVSYFYREYTGGVSGWSTPASQRD